MAANSGQDMSGFAKTNTFLFRRAIHPFSSQSCKLRLEGSNRFCTIDFSLHPASELPRNEGQLGVG